MPYAKDCFMEKEGKSIISKLIGNLNMNMEDEAIDILITLSDNKGYTKLGLESAIKKNTKKQGAYVYALLEKLSSNNFGDLVDSFSIQSYHIKDPLILTHKILNQNDLISKYIFNNIDELWMEELTSTNPSNIELFLPISLNKFLNNAEFYNKERFRWVQLSEEARELIRIKDELKGGKIRFLNRILIADAFPNEIYKTKISLIHGFRGSSDSANKYFINLDLRVFKFIVEKLKEDIVYDRKELDYLTGKLAGYLKIFKGYDKYLDIPEMEKFIKDGNCDIPFYKKRYEMRIKRLWKFMTSKYVQEIAEKYGDPEILLAKCGLNDTEFNFTNYFLRDVD